MSGEWMESQKYVRVRYPRAMCRLVPSDFVTGLSVANGRWAIIDHPEDGNKMLGMEATPEAAWDRTAKVIELNLRFGLK
jgi:hypothetical protein